MTTSNADSDELLTTGEVAELAKVSTDTVRRWRFDGDLPFFRLGYRTIRHRRGDVEELLWSRRRSADSLHGDTGREQSPVSANGD